METKKIILTNGKEALVDRDNFDELNQFVWHEDRGYAARRKWDNENRKQLKIYMHRSIMNAEKGKVVDHINGNKLDNTKNNLRLGSQKQNARNVSAERKNNTSGYKGVHLNRNKKRYKATITFNYKSIDLGTFDTKQEAAIAYNKAALKYFGEYAKLNEISEVN